MRLHFSCPSFSLFSVPQKTDTAGGCPHTPHTAKKESRRDNGPLESGGCGCPRETLPHGPGRTDRRSPPPSSRSQIPPLTAVQPLHNCCPSAVPATLSLPLCCSVGPFSGYTCPDTQAQVPAALPDRLPSRLLDPGKKSSAFLLSPEYPQAPRSVRRGLRCSGGSGGCCCSER